MAPSGSSCPLRVRVVSVLFAVFAVQAFPPGLSPARAADFRRGDANEDGRLDLSDSLRTFGYLFLGGIDLACLDAADSNDSGVLDLSDGVYTLNYLFSGGLAIPLPGPFVCGPDPTADSLDCVSYAATGCDGPLPPDLADVGHVLNRLGYGPSAESVVHVIALGVDAYVVEQLNPLSIDESGNAALAEAEDALFNVTPRSRERRLVASGDEWAYLKGTAAPPATWAAKTFDDAAWSRGPTGIGYGDGDDRTVLADMEGSYASVYARRSFDVEDLAAIHDLILRIDYDDGFVAYLNGSEISRRGLTGSPPAHTALATSHDAGASVDIDVSAHTGLLAVGTNVLAIQVHNSGLGSSDLSLIPELIDRELLPGPPKVEIAGVNELQDLLHVRGVLSRRQLQAVLGEFWENHFTTDLDKVADYLDDLQNSDATDAMTGARARAEAAQVEYLEYEFFHENAFGNFGDLLLASATNPTMLIYLDSVLNVKGSANENYPREILELHAFGVDNRYTQRDIEELSKCFTGWTVCKVARDEVQPFPERATSPPTDCGVKFDDLQIIPVGAGWRYWKGLAEPSPDGASGAPTTGWTGLDFIDDAWTAGSTGIGFGDGDDATVLSDMRNSYVSVYLRRSFQLADPASVRNLILEVSYDDAFVAYLNGVEVARSGSMGPGSPPSASTPAAEGHEVTEGAVLYNLNAYRPLLFPGENVLSFQVHNSSLDSSDLSLIPRLLDRAPLPGSIENGDPDGAWTFRFDPAKHDFGAKTLFAGTPYQIQIPAGRTGAAGLRDALDVISAIVHHPSTAEFICIKLIQRFVSDDISLARYKAGSVPEPLLDLLADAIEAWNSTDPPGNIETVLESIFDPGARANAFWAPENRGSKVKTPIEFLNSSLRALEGSADTGVLASRNEAQGMSFFTRDDPDGWSELGFRWIDTATVLERMSFSQTLAENRSTQLSWQSADYLAGHGASTAGEVVDWFSDLFFQGQVSEEERRQFLEFLSTDADWNPQPLVPGSAEYSTRVEEFVGYLLSHPRWNFQ